MEVNQMGIDQLRTKVQRFLTEIVGTVRVDADGDFRVTYNSATVFVECWAHKRKDGEERLGVKFSCPLVRDVPVTNSLFKWAATEGADYRFGNVAVIVDDKEEKALLLFFHNLYANDLDASEVENALLTMLFTADALDTELQKKFGGELFGVDEN